jgi:uncharacterized protein YndB with AHSA1/START domain
MADEHEQVTRSVDIDAEADDVWRAVADPGERGRWLDDPDARSRAMRVDQLDVTAAERRLTWTWWQPGDESGASTVSVVVAPREGGGTRVVITESLPAQASASAGAGAGAGAGLRALWSHRILGLELLMLTARAPAGVGVA